VLTIIYEKAQLSLGKTRYSLCPIAVSVPVVFVFLWLFRSYNGAHWPSRSAKVNNSRVIRRAIFYVSDQ